jgi:riboflavin kinase / FMN adenylyltransferase
VVKVYSNFEEIEGIKNPVLTIGTFDGVHVGHQKILARINKIAQEVEGESVLFTFFPHPRMVLNPTNHGLKLIQTQEEKIQKLEKSKLNHLIVQAFTTDFSTLTAREFVSEFLVKKLRVHTIVVGYDHQFGKNREGNFEHLVKLAEEFGFNVVEIPAHEIDDVNVSSTKIRKAIETGEIETANTYLNEVFQISGVIKKGQALGRKLGYPTANIQVQDPLKIIPEKGVYAVECQLENREKHFGMMNIGNRPTVDAQKDIQIEVHLFDFKGDIYGQKITAFILRKVRDELKFASIEDLQTQIQQDEKNIRSLLFAH